MNEALRLLEAEIRHDLQAVANAYRQLHAYDQRDINNETLILLAYHLHVIYGLFENMLVRIAANFANQIDHAAQWHALLLKRMTLDIPRVRPPVISEKTHHSLDELRRFRHLFRNAYVLQFDPDRLSLVLRAAEKLEHTYQDDFDHFLRFLDSLIED